MRGGTRKPFEAGGLAPAVAGGISAVLLLAAVAPVGSSTDPAAPWAWLPRTGVVLLVWLVSPLWQSVRFLSRPARGPAG